MSGQLKSYQLVIRVNEKIHLKVGRLGSFILNAGCYIYTGSAKRHINARIRRHLSPHKMAHWHMDYLSMHPDVRIVSVYRSSLNECELNQKTQGEIIISGFGASDCMSRCGGHLKKLPTNLRH